MTQPDSQVASGLIVDGPFAGRRRDDASSLRARLLRWWASQTHERAEDELVYRGPRSRTPLWLAIPLVSPVVTVPGVLLVREPDNRLAALLLLAGLLAIGVGAFSAWVERRIRHVFWFELGGVAFYAGIISFLLAVFVTFEHPRMHSHWVIFFLYFLLIGASGLSNDPRNSIASGGFSIIGFLAALAFLQNRAAAGNAHAERLLPEYEWVSTAARIAILAGITLTATASARRGLALRRASVQDPLTGLLNRRAFDWCLERQVDRARERGQPLSIAMIDIDHFKALNDGHGHPVGDAVLAWVADRLRESVRASDVVARYGGEEFVVAFVDTDDERLDARLESWRRAVQHSVLRAEATGREIPLTVSIGIARLPADASDASEVLARADERLYVAKRGGRNQLVDASPGGLTPLVDASSSA